MRPDRRIVDTPVQGERARLGGHGDGVAVGHRKDDASPGARRSCNGHGSGSRWADGPQEFAVPSGSWCPRPLHLPTTTDSPLYKGWGVPPQRRQSMSLSQSRIRRVILCSLLTLTFSSCSFVFVDGPPQVRPGGSAPEVVSCTQMSIGVKNCTLFVPGKGTSWATENCTLFGVKQAPRGPRAGSVATETGTPRRAPFTAHLRRIRAPPPARIPTIRTPLRPVQGWIPSISAWRTPAIMHPMASMNRSAPRRRIPHMPFPRVSLPLRGS